MRSNKIILAELDLDVKAALESNDKLKKDIDSLIAQQAKLKASGQTQTEQYKELNKQIVGLSAAYNNNGEALNLKVIAADKVIQKQRELESALASTSKTENEYAKNNEKLIAMRKELNVNDANYRQNIELINTKLRENNSWLQENGSAHAKLITTMSDYKDQVSDSFNSINIFNGGLSGLVSRMQEAGGAGPLLKNAFGGITGGIKGMGQAIASNPLGLLLMVIGPIIEQLKNFAPLTNAVEQAMAALSPVMNLVTIPVKILGESIAWVVEGLTTLMGAMSSTAAEATALKQAEQELATQMAVQEGANQRASQQANELIKKSQDVTLSEKERAKAVAEATAVMQKNYAERKAFTDTAYNVELRKLEQAKGLSAEELKILNEGSLAAVQKLMNDKNISTEELDVLEKAKVKKMEIANEENQIKEQQASAYKSITDGLISKSKDQSLSENERLKALQDAAVIEKKIMDSRIKDANDQYNNATATALLRKGITQQDLNGLLNEGNAYAGKARLVAMLSQQEVDALISAGNEKKRLSREETKMLADQQEARTQLQDQMEAETKAKADAAKQDAQRKRTEALNNAIAHQKQMLDLFIAEGSAKAKSLQEELNFETDKAEKSKAILKAELDAKKISRLEYAAAIKNLEGQTLQNLAQINTTNAKAQLDLYIQQNKDRLAGAKDITRELINSENERRNHIFDENVKILESQSGFKEEEIDALVAKKAILTTEQALFYTDLLKLREAHNGEILNADKVLKDAADAAKTATEAQEEKERADRTQKRQDDATERALDYEVKIAGANTQYQEQKLQEQERYDNEKATLDARLEEGQITKEQYAILEKNLDDENAKNKQKLALQNMQTQLGTMQNVASALGDAFGQNKELAIAQATMNAGQAILSIWSGQITGNPIVDTVLKGVLTASTAMKTAKQIKEIQSAKKPKQPKFAQGGLVNVGGNRHRNGGTMFTGADGTRFEAEQGELIGVMNRNAAAHFMAFNNAFPAGGSSAPNYFANGGIVSREIASPSLNIDELASKIAMANSAIPAPVVAVQDIVTQGNSYVQVRDAANF